MTFIRRARRDGRVDIQKATDLGRFGIIVPTVDTVEKRRRR